MREVRADWVESAVLAAHIEVGPHRLRADEPEEKGGGDTGASPHELLLSSLAACTSVTLRLYAHRKGWPLTNAKIRLSGRHEDGRYVINRQVQLEGPLDLDQRARLLEIADRCPVHRTLTGAIVINTSEAPAPGGDSGSMEATEP
jgi:putative redox protein